MQLQRAALLLAIAIANLKWYGKIINASALRIQF